MYGDKNVDGADWYSYKNFGNDYTSVKEFINNITPTMGGDYPESVYDGFFKSCENSFWRSNNKRMIILIGDAPPLERPLSDYSIEDVIKKAGESNIKMNFYPIVVMPSSLEGVPDDAGMLNFEKGKIISILYPNPSFGNLIVQFQTSDNYSIQIFNSTGALVLSDNFSGNVWKRDISNLTNGVYVFRAYNKSKKFETNKFILSE